MCIMILLLVAGVVIAHSEGAYVPLTAEQAKTYMQANPDGAAQDIIRMDYIEHVAPVAPVPGEEFVLRGRDLIWGWQSPMSVTWEATPPLAIVIDLKGGEQKNFAPPTEHGQVVIWEIFTALAGVGGALLGHALK
jgi:hypothetical protein